MVSSVSNLSSMFSQLFTKLDTKSQGYLELSDLQSAFSSISSSSSSDTSSASDVFSALDSDSDGKVTESEFTSTLSQLESQFTQMRMHGMGGHGSQGMAGNMPPPPPENDTGFTQDELQSQLDEIGSSDSERSSLISNVVNNFSAADTNGDGKVNFEEAMSYDQSSKSSSTSSTSSTTDTTSTTDSSTQQLLAALINSMGGGMMPPPPPQNDSGFTKDQLQSQLDEIGSTDSTRSSLISNIVNNFDAADTNGDGKVSNQEAMTYDQSTQDSTSGSSATSTTDVPPELSSGRL